MSKENAVEHFLTSLNEAVKQYVVYDGQSRMSHSYIAAANAPVGAPCGVTVYVYTGASDTTILARKEGVATWLQAMEDAQPTMP